MGIGLFQRTGKVSKSQSMSPALPRPDRLSLHVLVDSGPNARDVFDIRVNGHDSVSAIRSAVAAQIGHSSMSLFKVSIPWQANYQASAYTERYGVPASLLSVFPGYNLDDSSELSASGGARLPAYTPGTGSLRSRRSTRWNASASTPTVRDWFPGGGSSNAIDVLVRTASSSNLDCATTPSKPVTISARFTSSSSDFPSEEVILVDIVPTATINELKAALLLAAGRPVTAGLLNHITLWRVDMSVYELAYLDSQGALDNGQRPVPLQRNAAPSIPLKDLKACVGDYISSRCSRADPLHIDLSVHIAYSAVSALAPRTIAPILTYPMPSYLIEPHLEKRRSVVPLPTDTYGYSNMTAWASPNETTRDYGLVAVDQFAYPSPRMSERDMDESHPLVCAVGYENLGSPGLIGLGITMSPSPSTDTCSSRDEECASFPPTPLMESDGKFEDAPITGLSLGWTAVVKEESQTPKHLQTLFAPPTPTFA
ncbi:hypothetical protein CcaverHIS002_0107730 [Cutaneotrichosporon cavernicola]|uniref:Uncharacterized protein n=1 Tax=Cutaneotrichosporon cavernicola TaxID=279322 RepID=A0AA48I6N4_9TREE|nr:uncharacterized protein CcaverHIS019_0107680 [Cutaneotrichosporon cavernicola]BEI80244.1 hypothetical protein CcaverHIS002_0107730 [Cutaneotrichosporon cavernicola]BEI88050.1 hypothetical protein CcaverHIS019_0107680 [Cutaneotrichosporon cavernicola]BEI95822.1 hypothetical protein CcaverHIS631_0107710 [Cutaneotrichosporon cavernicola]BEJ03595.1 hypothetical protein CcaverHIS641_0107700 [Cutaneotrichosporon cavernicola]